MARRLSALRPQQKIIALTNSREVQNELALIWGVESLIVPQADTTEEMLKLGERALLEGGAVGEWRNDRDIWQEDFPAWDSQAQSRCLQIGGRYYTKRVA